MLIPQMFNEVEVTRRANDLVHFNFDASANMKIEIMFSWDAL